MVTQAINVECDQFIFSKYTGAPRSASYTLVACSPTISEEMVVKVRNIFNGCRPLSTALPSFTTSFIIAPIDGDKMAILRLDANNDVGSKNSHILYERYLIVDKFLLKEKSLKPWQFLDLIPNPETIDKFKPLPNYVNISSHSIDKKKEYVFDSLLSLNNSFIPSIFNSLYSLMVFSETLISCKGNYPELWGWITTLDALIPSLVEMNLRLFIGPTIPQDWHPNIGVAFVASQLKKETDEASLSYLGETHTFESMPEGYTKTAWRCTSVKSLDLFSEFLSWKESVRPELYVQNKEPFDLLLERELPPLIRLGLVRLEIQKNKWLTKDLFWLWRNVDITLDDVQVFLPILLIESLDEWLPNDFFILGKYIDRLSPQKIKKSILVGSINCFAIESFLRRWAQSSHKFSENEKTLYVDILVYLAKERSEKVFSILVDFLPKTNLISYKDVKRIFDVFPSDGNISRQCFWQMLIWLFNSVQAEGDINLCLDVMLSLPIVEAAKVSIKYLSYLSHHSEEKGSFFETNNDLVFAADQARVLSSFLPAMLKLSLLSSNPDALLAFALAIKNVKLFSVYKIDANLVFESRVKAVNSKDEKYISAYVFVLSALGLKDRSKDVLGNILINDSELFKSVALFTQENFPVKSDDFTVFGDAWNFVEKEDQLRLLIIYCISTQKIGELKQKLFGVNNLLMRVRSINWVEEDTVEEFLALLKKEKESSTACKVIEHQIRFEIKQNNKKRVQEKLKNLMSIISIENRADLITWTKRKVIVRYIRNLPQVARQNFSDWLLVLPLSSDPPINTAHLQPFTTELILNHRDWMKENAIIRYYLFEEISKWS